MVFILGHFVVGKLCCLRSFFGGWRLSWFPPLCFYDIVLRNWCETKHTKTRRMIGSLLKYEIEECDHVAIILEYLHGFHMRKTWSSEWYLVDQPLCRIYWLNEPALKPVSARHEIAKRWRGDDELSFGFGHPGTFSDQHRSIIKEWKTIAREENWYFLKNFTFMEKIKID